MPTYDYICSACSHAEEHFHMMSNTEVRNCEKCGAELIKQIGTGYLITRGLKPTRQELQEQDHTKKVKDPERARRMRVKAFGQDAVGDPVDSPDPKHIIKKGRTVGGQNIEVDKGEFIKAAAKDDFTVQKAQDIIQKQK